MNELTMPLHEGRELPRFTLRQIDLPEVRFWEVNSKHYIVLRVEMVSKSNTKALGINNSGDKGKMEGTFQVLNIKPLQELEGKDFERVVAGVKSGKIR